MGWIVYSKDGKTEKCVLHKLEYSGTFMGDRTVIATFSSEKKIDFSVFDYITYRGERFELELLPTVKKVSSYEYKYELRFVSLKYELERCMMRNIVPGDNGIVYPTPLSVEFTGDVKYLAERIQACLDAMYGKGAWSITIAESTESEEKNISMSNQNCWDALSLVNTEYKLNYFIKGRNVIIGGEEPVVDNVFEYGKGKGLYEIERISDTDTGVVTKLRAYGGTRNLDYSYPKLPDWKDSVLPANYALSPLRLMLPSFKADGKTDYVLASEEAIAKYGIREGTITYDDIYPSITGMKNSSGQAIDEIKSVSAITNETQPTFTVGLYDLGFDLNESLTTDEAQMSMKSGSLQGYTFNITKIERASDGSYTLTLGRNTLEKEDTGNFTVPNKDWNMKTGDKFVLLNILMPQAYIRDAENRLLARAKEYLAKYSSTNYSYNVGVDEIFMARNVNFYNDIMEGKRLTVNDQEIGINNENIIIQSLTIKEGEGIIPTFEVTLNNETTASTLDRIQGQISEVETSVSNNFSSQSELLKQYRKKLDKSVWDSIFVIHKDDSENPEKITSVQSLVGLWTNEFLSAKGLNPGSGGGSGEGGATALYQLNDVAKNASETGVIGAGPGKVLTYGNDGKWYAADAVGLDETALGKYLTDNNYAQKSDIPSLSGYATQSWVLGKNYITSDALSGYATQSWVNSQGYATASSLKAVSDKLNDFLEGSDTDGIINKWKELEAFLAGQTQTSTLADLLAVKADKATTLSGYGITDAYTKTEVNTKLGSYVTTTALNTALAKKVDVAFLAKVFGFIGEDSSEVSINDMGSVITSIKAKFGLWTDEYLSSKGLNPNAGGGSGEGATALYQLNDVSQNASGTGVLGAETGKVLTYGSDGKWYAAKAGMDEDALSSYLTENNYAQKSDIPSLNGYATQSWVNTALEKKVDKVSGMGLSHNDFTDTLLQKLNGIAEGANKYILPIAKAAVLGGVMIGSTLTASATGVLDLPEVTVAGTYAKVTTDVYGRVTAGSSLSASDIPALGISKITGLQAALDDKVNKADFVTEFDKAMQRWFVRDTANKGLHPADYDSEAVGIYSDSYMSAKGVNTGAGGSAGGASSLGELNNVGSWADDIPTVDRIMVQRKGETHWESLNLSDIGLNETQLSDYLTTNNYAKKSDIPSLSGYATQAWVNTKLADYATTSSVTTLLAEKVDKVEGKGLSANDFTDTLLNKLNGIEAGANKYVLPTASGSVLGGVKVGTTLSIANGVLNLKSGIATAGTYTKVTVDTYGRVVSGDSLVSGDIPTLAISKISGLQTALDDKANKDGSNATGTWGISITGSSRRLYQAPLTNEDLNDYTYANHSGKMYYAGGGNTTVNSPSDAYGLMVWRIAAGYTGQIGFGSNNNLYKRRIDNNGAATGWMRIVDEGNFSTILDTRYVTKTFLARLFGAMDADGNEIAINNTSTVIDSIKAKVGLWTEQYLSSKGLNPNAGSGEGSDYNRLDAWDDYSTDKSGYVLSAGLGWDLNTRVSSLESKAITLTTSGTGNGLSGFTQNGNTVTFSKATFLTEHQSLAGYATESWVNNKGYLVATSADKANWNTAFGWGDHSKAGYATQLWVTSKDYATIADLDARINALVNGAPEAFDTLKEIADVLQGNVNQIEDLLTAIGTKADKTITIAAGTGLNGGGTLAANRTINLSAATTKALGGIIVGDRLSIDSDGKLSATYTYTLPTASASVLGGVKVGTTLAISSGVLNLKAVGTAGTYFKTTTDAYGRVTAGSNPTTLAGFGITDGVNDVAYSGSGNAVTSATVSGHIITLVKGTTFLTKATFDDLFEKVNIGTASAPVYAIKAKYGLYTEQFLSSMGLNLGTGSGGGSDYDRLDTWADYDASKAGWVLSAGLGNDLNTRVTSLENGAAVTVTPSGSGTVVKDVTKNGTVITVTKGDLAFGSLTGKPTTISGYGITDAYTKTQADAKYVTLDTDQTITATKVFKDPDLRGALHVWRNGDGLTSLVSFYSGATTKTLLGSIGFVTANVPMFYKTTNNAVNLLHAENYTSYTVTKTGTGASGTWGINVNGYAHRLHQALGNKTAEQVFTDNGVYYYQVSSAEDTGYPTDYGHGLMLQRSSGATLTSSQAVLDIFTPTSGTNLVYLRTGIGNGTKITWQAFQQILHTGNYTSLITKLGTATVGSNTKFFYLNAGTPTASTATVGSSSLPVYMNAGTITQCSTTLGVSVTGYSKRLLETVLTNEDLDTYTYSSYSGRTYSAGGGNTVANKPEGVDSFGLLVLRSAGGYTTHLAVNGANLFSRYHNSTTWSDWYKFAFVTSNVASATKLQTARTINGTSFDGTANITTAKWGTARTLAIAAASKSIDGSTNITISRADMNVSAGDESIFTGTTVANTWYRIASSPANISSITGIFSIYASASGYHTNCLLTVSTSYGNTASTSIQQLSCAHYGNPLITQARIVYHTTYDAHYAYLEILVPTAITSTFVVRFSLPGQNFWALNTSLVAGSIPSGYTSKAITLKNSCIVANVTGNLTGNVTGNLTGNASTATSLQTARTLWGQSFNGTANITGTLLGVESVIAKSGRFNNFLAYYDTTTTTVTGTICITLPNGWTSSMNTYEILIYEYNTTANASVITIGGYNYNGGGTASSAKWVNIGYHTKGSYSKGVRLGYNGSKCVILLGTTATTWSYPKVYLKAVYTGYGSQTIWGGTYSISVLTSETGYTNIEAVGRMDEFFGDTSVTGRLAVTGAGHFGYTYTTMTAGINVKGDSATTGISIYDGTGTTARLYRKGDILYITRAGNDASGILMSTAGSIYPGANNTLTNGTTTNRWSGVYTQLLNVAGAATFSSTITASGEIRSTSAKAFRAIQGSYGFFIYNNGSDTHFLLTAKDDQYGTYNSLRPLAINNSTGVVTMSNGTNIGGILNVTNTTDATTTTAAAIKTAGGLAVAKQLRVGGAATLSSSLYVTGSATFMGGIRIGDYWLRSTADGLELSHATSGKTAGLYATGFLSSMGLNPGTGEGGSGSDYDRLDAWDDYSADKAGYVLSAKLGNDLNTRVKSLEGGSALTVTTTGSGNAVTSVAKSGTAITVTKGTTFVDLASAQTITGQKTWTVSQRMANTSIHRVNNASGGNATGSHWYTANYAAIQFGIGLYTDSNASPRAYIGWTSTPWVVSTNLTVSETSLTYKGNAILHAANYNTYAPTKTGGGASGSWGISITGNAANATTSSMLTVKDVRGESRLPSYFEEKRVTAWFNNTGNPASNWFSGIHVKGWTDTYMSWELATYSDVTSTTNSSLYYRNGLGSTWHAWRTIVDSHNYTSYVLKIGTATVGGTAKPIYLNAGTPTALSSTVGDSTVPAYLNAGTVTACSWGLIGTTGKRVRKSGYITSGTSGLSSYWGKIASFDWGDASGERDITLYIHSAFNSLWGTVVIRTRWSSATSTIIDFRIINGNIPTSRLRLYYDVSAKDNVITLWGDVNAQWGAFNTYVLSETTRTSSETGDVTLYTTSFTTAQTLPTSTYKTPTYLSILNNADTATTLQTSRTIFGKSFNGSANVAGQALVYGTYQETASSRYSNGGLQIRENGMVGSAQTADGYAPAIGFHWANRIGASLILTTSGFKFMNQAFTGYQNVYGIFKGNADSATQVYSTLTNPTTGTWYVIPFHTGASTTNKLLLNNNGIQYYSLEGTASAQGEALIQIGNSTATGTAGNKRGRLRLYSSSSGWADFTLTATTGNYTLTLPAATGTVALTSSNVASATKLQTARTLWGQSFNGTANVSGSMTGVGPNIVAAANITMTTTGEGNNLSLKYNNDDTKSVVLNTSAFKPFDLATNKLNLGTSAARWLGVYANTGNFSSTVTGTRFISTVATGTAPLTVSSTTVVTNLNADMVDGIHSSNIPLEYDASYTPTGTTARWLRIAYFDYSSASYSWSGTFAITNTYVNDENKGLIFTVSTAHGTTSPVITQIGGASGVFTSIRIVKDTTTVYPTTAKVYLEVYYNSTSAANNVYVSYKPANRAIGKWTLYTTYTAGSIPTGHTAIAQLYTTSGLSTTANLRVQGTAVILGATNHNDRLDIQSDGKIVPHSTATRRSGVYGVYDAAKIGHIWSMGTSYMIADDGSGFGNLYGFAYQYSASDRATGHQAVWCVNGAPKVALGNNFWVASSATIGGTLTVTGAGSVNTLTIKNTEAVGHIKFSRGNFNYITAPTSGIIAFVVNGQGVGDTTSELIIQDGALRAGTTNVTSLGQEAKRWSNMYSVLLNVSGVATLSSTVNIAGVLNANNATDATSTTAAGAVFDGGVGIAKQLRVGGNVTIAGNVNFANSGQLSVPYTGGQWISMATRTNLIIGKENTSEASAHALYRVKSFAGDAVVFGGLKNSIGFYGFYKARIDSGDNGSDWATTWNTTTGALTHNKAMTVSGAVTFNSTLTVASTGLFNLSTDATSTTAAAVRIVGGLAVGKQLRVGGAATLSSTLAVTSTSTFTGKTTHNGGIGATTGTFSSTLSAAGVVSFTNATDATSTTAAAVKISGGLGIAKQLRVGGASTFSGTINTSVATFIKLGANATDQKILKDVDGNGFYSGISFFGTKGSNMGVSDIMMNIYAGGAIQIHSQAGSGQILLNGTVHNNVGMYSDGYMSSKGLNDTSDMRLKNKGRDIFLSVKDIAHAPAFEYTWKDGTPGVMAGSSAQYWQKVLPPSVKVKKDGYMTMFYGHTALVATISLARHVETLEERVERLERENKEKDKRIKELERRISA
nr:MAG TPA: Head fiber protein [Caudoviricetes sp.]